MKADYKLAAKKAYEILNEYNIKKLPIDIFSIIDSYKNIELCSFSEIQSKFKYTKKDIKMCLGSKLGAVINKNNKYIIYYNDKIGLQTSRFTIAHEFAHIILGHFYKAKTNVLVHNLNNKVLEYEANCFARNILAPVFAFKSAPTNTLLQILCDISWKATRTRLSFYETDIYYYKAYESEEAKKFLNF